MYDQPELSEMQWQLIIELLEHERDELPVEIRHTRSTSVRTDLQHRAEIVRETLEQVSPMHVV
jgi:hypothetical protein